MYAVRSYTIRRYIDILWLVIRPYSATLLVLPVRLSVRLSVCLSVYLVRALNWEKGVRNHTRKLMRTLLRAVCQPIFSFF